MSFARPLAAVLTTFALAIASPLAAQSVAAAQPVVAVLPLEATGISDDEADTIDALVQSYVSSVDGFRLVAAADRERILSELEFAVAAGDPAKPKAAAFAAADFLLSASIRRVDATLVFTLEIIKVKTGEKKSYSGIYPNVSALLLDTRALVLRVFEREAPAAAAPAAAAAQTAPELTESRLIGSWRGDKGIELVRIQHGGTAVALMSSGAQMQLTYTISGSVLRIVQASPNIDRFYYPLPFAVAQQFAALAKPMEWTFELSADGASLRGKKTATALRYEQDKILEVIHGTIREAEWQRVAR